MRKISFICFFSFINVVAYSQVTFGVKSGINIATTKDIIAFPKNKIGWYGGGFTIIPVHAKFFLQPEIQYSSKGYGVNQRNPYNAPNPNYRFNYLCVPILAGYKIDKKTSLLFGPEMGYLMVVREVFPDGDNLDVSKSYPPKFDVGLDIGVNYNVIEKIGIEVRYNYGFNTLYAVDATGNGYGIPNGANRVFQIGLNYILK
jgi:hypothetical protein